MFPIKRESLKIRWEKKKNPAWSLHDLEKLQNDLNVFECWFCNGTQLIKKTCVNNPKMLFILNPCLILIIIIVPIILIIIIIIILIIIIIVIAIIWPFADWSGVLLWASRGRSSPIR